MRRGVGALGDLADIHTDIRTIKLKNMRHANSQKLMYKNASIKIEKQKQGKCTLEQNEEDELRMEVNGRLKSPEKA